MTENQKKFIKVCLDLEEQGKKIIPKNIIAGVKDYSSNAYVAIKNLVNDGYLLPTGEIEKYNVSVYEVTDLAKTDIEDFGKIDLDYQSAILDEIRKENLAYRIVKSVKESQPASANHVCGLLGYKRDAISQYFSRLHKAGILKSVKEGQSFMYSINEELLNDEGIELD
jgi:DNA-binding transcriptional ArsR family regulator